MLFAFVPDRPRRSVGDPHTQGGEARLEFSFGAKAPTNPLPLSLPQHVFADRDRTCGIGERGRPRGAVGRIILTLTG